MRAHLREDSCRFGEAGERRAAVPQNPIQTDPGIRSHAGPAGSASRRRSVAQHAWGAPGRSARYPGCRPAPSVHQLGSCTPKRGSVRWVDRTALRRVSRVSREVRQASRRGTPGISPCGQAHRGVPGERDSPGVCRGLGCAVGLQDAPADDPVRPVVNPCRAGERVVRVPRALRSCTGGSDTSGAKRCTG